MSPRFLSSRRDVLAIASVAAAALPMTVAAKPVARAASGTPPYPWTDRGTIARAGGVLAWQAMGPADAPTVVLLHKLGGWIADWLALAPLLANRHRVIAFDLPGHGDSRWAGPPPFVQSVDETAALVLAGLSELGVEQFSVAGNSLGGIIGITMADRWPARVERLMLLSVSLFAGQNRDALAEVERKRDPAVYTADWRPLPRTAAQVSRFGSLNPAVEAEQNASRARADYWVRPSERGVALNDTEAALARTRQPLLLVYADRGHYTRYAEVGRKCRPDATLVTIPGAGSFVHQEKPAETAAAMRSFLAQRG
ncbi:MAG: alpha/beta fold hydrolase [Novosphingobium sp.]|uniref:alpha/beta fold hydrolase n=1 Tax=Novosphingobium sp. TaxID=1874826 RepID=UPI00273538A7|nr:alpha/beta fold hydrolase [Novosphingobium sp.]MDP3550480.1 alpha/beta fold hydrolase [Novosphingobium sp.]